MLNNLFLIVITLKANHLFPWTAMNNVLQMCDFKNTMYVQKDRVCPSFEQLVKQELFSESLALSLSTLSRTILLFKLSKLQECQECLNIPAS